MNTQSMKARLGRLEKSRPKGKRHLVWRNEGESSEEAITRYRETYRGRIDRNDQFDVVGWAESREALKLAEHKLGLINDAKTRQGKKPWKISPEDFARLLHRAKEAGEKAPYNLDERLRAALEKSQARKEEPPDAA
ncbi:hypothetical protein Dalk_2801 [Desulfatibacillum aliphaticivorans]|uniref:Uncharacterized protein n=1 Tax=Desulfatibacillum aliphaticivorans TaxID=218208 RepID=B8FKX0_DESAL|nr:hypothetical protein [Desulfatibacillum aliphaticivorans]ACL04492.1 hypothetical protein Dalk_2801 [Desulfatibacillum aliphaticivorans]